MDGDDRVLAECDSHRTEKVGNLMNKVGGLETAPEPALVSRAARGHLQRFWLLLNHVPFATRQALTSSGNSWVRKVH
jgi:hypothetical protein